MKNIKFISLFLVFIFLLILTPNVFATSSSSEDNPENSSESILSANGIQGESLRVCLNTGCCDICDFITVLSNVVNFLRTKIAFPLTILLIVYGSALMIFSGGEAKRSSNGAKAIKTAIIGLAIVFGASLIVNSLMITVSKSPFRVEALMNGEVEEMKCTKSCTSGSDASTTGNSTELNSKISSMIDKLKDLYGVTVTSTTGGQHAPGSCHYKGRAADIWTNDKSKWPEIRNYIRSQGLRAECDNSGTFVQDCNQADHIHFDTGSCS